MNKLFLVGIGPGSADGMTQAAKAALEQSEVLCGYTVYLDLVRQQYPDKETYTTPMTRELERCRGAIDRAAEGKTVAMLCSGDAGVYGMAGPVLELAEGKDIRNRSGARGHGGPQRCGDSRGPADARFLRNLPVGSADPVGGHRTSAPLCGGGGFLHCTVQSPVEKAPGPSAPGLRDFIGGKSPDTVCGWVKNIGRPGQCHGLATLKDLGSLELDMFTTVFIGASTTKNVNGRMVTPRGYQT